MKMRKMKGWIGTRDTHLPTRLADAPQTARVGEIQDKEWDSPPLRHSTDIVFWHSPVSLSMGRIGVHFLCDARPAYPDPVIIRVVLSWLSLNHSIHLNHSIPSDRHLIGPTNQSKGTQVQSMLFSVDPVCTVYIVHSMCTVCTQIRIFAHCTSLCHPNSYERGIIWWPTKTCRIWCGCYVQGWIDLFDGHFVRAMEWLMFFSRAPSASMVFQWFCQYWNITI